MAQPDFPASPTVGQTYTAPSGLVYTWDGAVWSTTSAPQNAYWSDSGTELSPTVTTRRVVVPGPTANPSPGGQVQVVAGSRQAKMRLQSLASIKWDGVVSNGYYDGTSWYRDSTTDPLWSAVARPDASNDTWGVEHSLDGSTFTTPFSIHGSDGKTYCTLADKSVTRPMYAVNSSWQTFGSAQLPVNFSNVTANTWLKVVDCPAITTRGGYILVVASIGGYFTVNPSGGSIYWALYRNGVQFGAWEYPIKSPTTANTQMAVPSVLLMDAPGAGTYTYSLYVYQGTNTLFLGSGSPGWIMAWELS